MKAEDFAGQLGGFLREAYQASEDEFDISQLYWIPLEVCDQCDLAFAPTRPRQTICGECDKAKTSKKKRYAREYMRKWRREAALRNPEHERAKKDRKNRKDREKRRKLRQDPAAYRAHREKANRQNRERRARVGDRQRHHLPTKIMEQGWMCGICGEPLPHDMDSIHIDHIIPKSRGGSNNYDNLQAAHDTCNISKGNRTMDEYRAIMGEG